VGGPVSFVGMARAGNGRTFFFKRLMQQEPTDVLAQTIPLEKSIATMSNLCVDDTPGIPVGDPARLIAKSSLPE
jgi:hypothetical protein